jgi:hypothetical protein
MYHWARVAVQHGLKSRLAYAAVRSRSHSHDRALRSIADRPLNVACLMLKTGTTFNPSIAAAKNVLINGEDSYRQSREAYLAV